MSDPLFDLTLTDEQRSQLESRLTQFEAQKGAQVGVLILPTTKPETIEQYAVRVQEEWQLGRAGVDDGVLLVVASEDRTVRIEVGYVSNAEDARHLSSGAFHDALAEGIAEAITRVCAPVTIR